MNDHPQILQMHLQSWLPKIQETMRFWYHMVGVGHQVAYSSKALEQLSILYIFVVQRIDTYRHHIQRPSEVTHHRIQTCYRESLKCLILIILEKRIINNTPKI